MEVVCEGFNGRFCLVLLLLSCFVAYAQEATEADLQTQLDAALAKISSLESRLATEQTAVSNLRVKYVQDMVG